MKPNLFKTMLVTLLTMLVAMNASAQTQNYFSCNFDNYTNPGNLTSNGWEYSGSVTINGNNPYRYGSSGKGLQLGTTKGASGQATTPALNTSLPSDVQLSFYAVTGGYNNVSLTVTVLGAGGFLNSDNTRSESVTISIANGSSKFYNYNLTGCTSATKIKFYANKICALDEITVTGAADTRTPVTLEYSADKYRTATESGEITGAPTLTVTPTEAASEVVYSSSDENVAKFDEDGKLIAVAAGTTTITASISGSVTYRDAKDEYTLTVGLTSSNLTYNPTSVTVTYDKKDNFTAPELSYTGGYNGTITYTSSNPSVATVNENGEVTILAVGVTTINASGAATQYLKASEAFFTLTVNDIQGSATGTSLFKETFDKTLGTGGDREGQSGAWSGNITQKPIVADENDWIFYSSKQGGNQCIRQGADGKKGYAKTRQIEVEMGKSYTLTFKAAPWNQESTKMKVTADGCEIRDISEDVMTPYYWNDYAATITPITTGKITIRFEATKDRFFLDEINVIDPNADNTEEVTIPSSGWGTYCCKWPLDFTAVSTPEGLKPLKAYAVSASSPSNVTLTEINQKLIGGTGIIINGTPGATYTIKVADKGTSYEGTNMLTGTLAPTYIKEGQYFLKSGTFVYSKAGTLPANKAYLKSDGTGTQGAKLSFLFDTTSIEQVKVDTSDAWYDLSGRKVNPSANVKGVYIHNGKKVVK
ncbi:MAG: Ig-like domain-containing protein [Prevotella sp.]|nr:Ig-like domain-containing protein [Prevotella sp.]